MNKHMIGDIFVVVIDEIGEVTFARAPMFPHNVEIGKKESAARCFAALVELLSLCSTLVPVSKTQFNILKATESMLAEWTFLLERFTEQVEFSDSLGEAAGSLGLLDDTTHKRPAK